MLLPYRALYLLGCFLGAIVYRLPGSFRRTAERNIDLCFPEFSPAERAGLVRAHFRSLGIGVFETAISWWSSNARVMRMSTLEGREHLDAALALGKGAILLSAHFTTLEIGACVLCATLPTNIMYRPTSNLVLEAFLMRNRARKTRRAIRRDDVRTVVTALKSNEPVWYAPDQSYRKKGAQMVPLFGIPAATNTATSRLAKMTGAAVLPYFQERLPKGSGYRMVIHPMLEHFPTDDPVADATRFNHLIEAQIRRVPEQYLWIHRRFKGLTPEYPDYYGRKSRVTGHKSDA